MFKQQKKINNNGHDYVDLGLPSGNLWASKNIGAENPEDLGLWFKWGTTEGKSTYSEANSLSFPYIDKYTAENGPRQLELSDDAAHINWAGDWVMPNLEDYLELFNHTQVFAVKDDESLVELTMGDPSSSVSFPEGLSTTQEYCNMVLSTSGNVLRYRFKNKSNNNYIDIPGWGRPDQLPTSWTKFYGILLSTLGMVVGNTITGPYWNSFIGNTMVGLNGRLTSMGSTTSLSTSNVRPVLKTK